MRTLPENPNLEHLKQQAKDVLAALRESQPEATLAQAQRTVAGAYGCSTWTDLKREVERRREHAEPADADLVAAIAQTFALGEPSAQGTVVAKDDTMGPVLRLETASGRWRAWTVLPWLTEPGAAECMRLMEAAAAAGVLTPTPVRTPAGALIGEAREQRWRVDRWLDLGPALPKPAPGHLCFEMGHLMGTLHSLHLTPSTGMNPWLTERRSAERWHEILTMVQDSGAAWAPALAAALPAIIDLSIIGGDTPPDGLILSHTDLANGVRLGPGRSLVVLGWEFSGAIPPRWDLGMLLHAYTETTNGTLHLPAARPIVNGYAAATGALPELDVTMFTPAITAWLNWLASRMGGALHSSDADARARFETELGHMLTYPLTRRKLERILSASG